MEYPHPLSLGKGARSRVRPRQIHEHSKSRTQKRHMQATRSEFRASEFKLHSRIAALVDVEMSPVRESDRLSVCA